MTSKTTTQADKRRQEAERYVLAGDLVAQAHATVLKA